MIQESKRKRGRPAGSISRQKQYRLTFSDEESDDVDYLCRITGKTKADIFREAIKMYKNLQVARLPDELEEETFYDEDDYFDEDFY